MPFPITKCSFCEYKTNVKCNIIRHHNAKHKNEIYPFSINCENGQNVCPNGQNVCPNEQNVCPNGQNVCPKCNKTYKTKKHLVNHESRCNGLDELTCSRCMTSFTTRSAKHKHIRRNKCQPKSIIHARTPNIQNITNNNIQNIQNINNNTINNNLNINNFGYERTDYISNDQINKILVSGINTLPLYIQMKHFNQDFPENNNITFTNENKCKVLENNVWKEKDLINLSSQLLHNNSEVLLVYCEDNEVELSNLIKNDEIFERIKDKLIIIYNKADSKKYNEVLSKIKDLVKNNNVDTHV